MQLHLHVLEWVGEREQECNIVFGVYRFHSALLLVMAQKRLAFFPPSLLYWQQGREKEWEPSYR